MSISKLRVEYGLTSLDEFEVAADPIDQFRQWLDFAISLDLPEPNAMTLATSTADGRPSARVVLLKGVDARGFMFATNRRSRKGRDLAENAFASLVFFYPTLERQVRVEGRVELTSDEESDAYFQSRPVGAKIGAWASHQSEVVADRSILEDRYRELESQFSDREIPRPPHWGGYRVVPDVIEFWQGRANRLHDRLRYRKVEDRWIIERLEP